MLRVTEKFVSLEGETSLVGLPCFFIRLTGCNLRCRYCDTQYAYDEGTLCSTEDLLESVKNSGLLRIVITGGEPLIQRETVPFINELIRHNYVVILETNGSQPIVDISEPVIRIIDIKVPSSGEMSAMNWDNLKFLRKTDQIKFVLSNKHDFNWLHRVIVEYDLASRVGEILLSPVQGKLSRRNLAGWILESGLDVRFQLQLHKIIWGKGTRGV